METNTNAQPGKPARIGRAELGFNIVLQLVLLVAAVVMLNWLGNKYYARWDWSHGKNISLSPQTKSLLANLEKPVEVIVMFAGVGEAEQDAVALLREYQFAAKTKLTIENVNPFANLARAKELQTKYKFGASDNVVIFVYDGRHKFVNSFDLAEVEQLDQMAMMSGRRPQMLAFKGEQVFTSTLLELTEPKQNKLYLVSGHGEYDGATKELSEFRDTLTKQNLKFDTLKLADKDRIPDDASMVAILAPRFDFTERDIKMLSDYWDKNGRILIGSGWTNGKTPKLDEWLASRGVRPQNDVVIRIVNLGGITGMQPLEAVVKHQGSPITKELDGVASEMYGATQSLLLDQNLARASQIQMTALLTAPEGFWGETEYSAADRNSIPFFDPKKDHAGPLTLGVAIERGGSSDPKVKLETSRLVVFGNGDFLSNEGMKVGQVSSDLAINSINWLLNRENLISIPPKVKEKQVFQLTAEEIGKLRMWTMLLAPLAIAVFGLYHLMWRSGKNLFSVTLWLAAGFLAVVGAWLALRWQLGLWKPTFRMSAGFWIAVSAAVGIGAAAAVANSFEQKRRAKNQD